MEYILKHSDTNPRNSEGSFVKLADGTLYFAYSRFCGEDGKDHAAADIAAITSQDNGETWSTPFIIRKNRQMNLMSVSLLRLQNGRIGMIFGEKTAVPGWKNCVDSRPWFCFSDDEAKNWSEPVRVADVPPAAYFVTNNDRLVQLKDGRLILPVSHHSFGSARLGAGVIRFFISDDSGETWRSNENFIYPDPNLTKTFMEPGVIELANGTLMCFIRTIVGHHYQSFSTDRGESWTPAQPYRDFYAPESPMSMKRDPRTGKIYAIWNDYHPLRRNPTFIPKWARTPLVMAESSDEGVTWENHRILENAPDHGYCYTAMHFDGDLLYLAYCCGGEPECSGPLQDTKLSAIKLD